MLRAGIVGAGWIGRRHAETIAGRDDIGVAAVCDIDLERAGEVAALSGETGGIEDAVSVLLNLSSGALGTIVVVAWTNDDLPGRYLVDLTTADAAVQAFVRSVLPLLAAGRALPEIDRVYPADEAATAFDYLAKPGKTGKILLDFG